MKALVRHIHCKKNKPQRGGGGCDKPFGQVHLAQSGPHVRTSMVGHHGNVGGQAIWVGVRFFNSSYKARLWGSRNIAQAKQGLCRSELKIVSWGIVKLSKATFGVILQILLVKGCPKATSHVAPHFHLVQLCVVSKTTLCPLETSIKCCFLRCLDSTWGFFTS